MKPFESLDQALDITPMEQELGELKKATSSSIAVRDKEEDKERDYQHIRNELYSLIEKGQTLIDGVMDVAEQSQHPRAYEVAINSVKNVSEIAEKLMDLHKKLNDVSTEETKISQTNVQNNVFVAGTTSEIMKMLKDANTK
ncbi:DNA terminase [Synechococcus phage S-CRM01]|uniref:terminase small subunit n=1 Tax=Synechococcus phage S-CRM01 TaxID=1026955 RepID=UPI000209E34A|nr:terminase small subunit [Synechococcus phage S-CRM01]AEC52979.1 DNA terminase [Synechococcus phage S-CRM01]